MADFYTQAERATLLRLARASIAHGLAHHAPRPVDLDGLTPALRDTRATFVTLKLDGELRGCIGTLEARRALAEDVAFHAFAAAFNDPRFPPVVDHEVARLNVHIAVLTAPAPIDFADEPDLLARLEPGVDGLVLEAGAHRATFLPAVWDALPDPAAFLRHLKLKAGLAPDAAPANLRVSRYRSIDIA